MKMEEGFGNENDSCQWSVNVAQLLSTGKRTKGREGVGEQAGELFVITQPG